MYNLNKEVLMKKEREEYLDIIRKLDGDYEGRKKAACYVKESDCYIYGLPAPFSFIPTFYTEKELEFMRKTTEMTHSILSKAIRQYVKDPEYRKLFAFSKEVEDLITIPCGYEEQLPMSRFDAFLNEDDFSFKFCEFNADGAAAMSRTQIGCEALELTESFKEFCKKHEPEQFEYFATWADALMETYASDKNVREGKLPEKPNVLITDFRDAVTMSDVTRMIAAFRNIGINARFVDVRELKFDGVFLRDPLDGAPFTAVYRRVCTSDVAKNYDKCKALIDAARAERIVLIGHFRTTVPHAKMINVALRDGQTKAFLTEEEWAFVQEHVLPTYRLRTDTKGLDIDEIKRNKDGWIIKPEDDYDSHGVFAGGDLSQTEWEETVDKYTDKGYVAMVFYVPPLSKNARPFIPEEGDKDFGIEDWHSMTGMYSYNGRFTGFFSRMGQEFVISESHNGVSIPSFYLKGE